MTAVNSRAHILHVIDNTVSGGAQSQLESIIQGLRSEYIFSVAVLGRSGHFSAIYDSLGVSVHQIRNSGSRRDLSSFPGLLKLIHREKPDLIHAHLFKSMIFAGFAARLTGIPYILHDHSGLEPESLRFYFPKPVDHLLYSLAFRSAIRSSKRLLGLTQEICHGYVRYFHIPPEKVEVIPNTINLDRFKDSRPAPSNPLREELGLEESCKVIVMIGRLAPEKDWFTFLKIASQFPDPAQFAFVVVGEGGLNQQLRRMASELGLENVHFLGDRQDVPSILKEANLFLLTSCKEAFGIVLLEAMASGCPVIATRTAGPADIIQPGVNGLLVDVGDVDGFARALQNVLSDTSLAEKLKRNADQSLRQFNLPVVSKRLSEIYRQVFQENGTKPS
jgi:glycosyltransferase involved in cell wall biosynthesis